MPPPKRTVFSLNLDTATSPVSKDGARPIDSTAPSHTHSDLQYVTKPFENLVNRTVNEVVEGTGKTVNKAEGKLSYSSTETPKQKSDRGTLNITSKLKRRNIERKYDTSEL